MPHFSLFRCFTLCLLLAAGLMPCPAGAVDVKAPWYPPWPRMYSNIPRHYLRFPFVIHLLAERRKGDPDVPRSVVDAGRLILSEDRRLVYVPGELSDARIDVWVDHYADVGGVELVPPGEQFWTAEGNILVYGLSYLVEHAVVVDAFFVTCGQEPAPGYIPRYERQADGRDFEGYQRYSFRPLNPLPNMRLMRLEDFSTYGGPAWCR